MSIETNSSFYDISLKELEKDDCDYDILRKLVDHIQISAKNDGSTAAITICNENFTDTFVGAYCIREDGAGNTLGLYKNVNNNLVQIKLAVPGELALIRGSGTGDVVPPKGWRLVSDESLQRKYNVGSSPNWEVALIEYVGI